MYDFLFHTWKCEGTYQVLFPESDIFHCMFVIFLMLQAATGFNSFLDSMKIN